MTNGIFESARRLVSAREAAEHYGFQPNRAGYICCPFHNERTPSLKLYPDGGWRCFGCHGGGSSVDFVMRLFDLSPLEAVRRMDADFSLALPLDKPPSMAQQRVVEHRRELLEVHRAFEDWRGAFIDKLNAAYRTGYLALRDLSSMDDLTEKEILAVRRLETLEYWSDCLSYGSMEEQMQIFRERGDIGRLCEKILNNTPMKFGAA